MFIFMNTVASQFTIVSFFCITSVLLLQTESGLLQHICLTVMLLSILIQKIKSFY